MKNECAEGELNALKVQISSSSYALKELENS
jgi:hypothetical protein